MRRILVLAALVLAVARCDAGDRFTLALKGSYTTSTRFMYNINEAVPSTDDFYLSWNFGYAADVRWSVTGGDMMLGLSVERIRSTAQSSEAVYDNGVAYDVPVVEGFTLLPVELSGYFVLPLSSDDVRVYIGGGLGMYYGERIHSIAGVTERTVNAPSGFGIHVLTGADIRLTSGLFVRTELKFRDPQFDSVNHFDQSSVAYEGLRVRLNTANETTRINLNGITYDLGLAVAL